MGEEYYILEHLETVLICKSPALPKHASRRSVITKHKGERCNMLVPQRSYLLLSLGKIAYSCGPVTYTFFFFFLLILAHCVLFAEVGEVDILLSLF